MCFPRVLTSAYFKYATTKIHFDMNMDRYLYKVSMHFILKVLSIEVKHSNSTQIEEYMEDKGYKLMKQNTSAKEASVDHIYVSTRHKDKNSLRNT